MSDTVEIKTTVGFKAWPVPTGATIGDDSEVPLEELADEVVEALARRWLDNLYAARGQASPFAVTRIRGAA